MISYLKLIRYKNLLMVLLTMILTKYALINSYVVSASSDVEFLALSISVILITAGGYVVNDIFDVEADKINKPKKVIITQSISKKQGWTFYIVLNCIGVFLGLYLSFNSQLISLSYYFIGTFLLLFLYSKYLKRLPLIGNLLISILVSMPMFLVYEFQNSLAIKNNMFTNLFLFIVISQYILFAFLSTFVREIIKDIEDVKGDYNLKMKTLPILLGRKRTRNIAIVFTMIFFSFLILTLKEAINSTMYYLLTIILIGIFLVSLFIYKLWNAETKNQFHYLSNLMKIIMLLGILSMGLFKFM